MVYGSLSLTSYVADSLFSTQQPKTADTLLFHAGQPICWNWYSPSIAFQYDSFPLSLYSCQILSFHFPAIIDTAAPTRIQFAHLFCLLVCVEWETLKSGYCALHAVAKSGLRIKLNPFDQRCTIKQTPISMHNCIFPWGRLQKSFFSSLLRLWQWPVAGI